MISWYGSALDAIVHPEGLPQLRAHLRSHLAGRVPDFAAEFLVRLRSGEWSWIDAHGTVGERDELGQPLRMVGTFSNIDARKHEEARMRRMAHEDALTGLPNRVLLGDRLRQAIRAASRDGHKVALIYFDLDKFKPVNDTHGHAAGVAENILGQLNEPFEDGDLVHRISGSLGCAVFPDNGLDADALLRSADLAMSDAKSHGRNRVSSRYRGEAA